MNFVYCLCGGLLAKGSWMSQEGLTGKGELDVWVVKTVTRRPGNIHGMRARWAEMGGESTKGVYPVHLVDKCS